MMEAKEKKTTQNTLIEDLSESIGRLKISFSTEDLSVWAVSHNADEKMLLTTTNFNQKKYQLF